MSALKRWGVVIVLLVTIGAAAGCGSGSFALDSSVQNTLDTVAATTNDPVINAVADNFLDDSNPDATCANPRHCCLHSITSGDGVALP